jgi:hypothetical protein
MLRKGSRRPVNRVDRPVYASPHEVVALLCAAEQLSALTFVSLCCVAFCCAARVADDWASCPCKHEGERASRRNLDQHPYMSIACHYAKQVCWAWQLSCSSSARTVSDCSSTTACCPSCHCSTSMRHTSTSCCCAGCMHSAGPGVQQPAKPCNGLLCADIMPACCCALQRTDCPLGDRCTHAHNMFE